MLGRVDGALALPVGALAQAPTQDSVRATGQHSFFGPIDVSAQSGPSGENPSGTVLFQGSTGPVTCLTVDGNTAYVAFDSPLFSASITAKLVDGGPAGSGLDRFDAFFTAGGPVPNCGFTPFDEAPVTGGDVVVVDAQPLPTSKAQCQNGGWRVYGVFKNQGDCVSFVATGGRNSPAGP